MENFEPSFKEMLMGQKNNDQLIEICVSEDIHDEDTFLELDNDDFNRLNLTTGLRKKITKLQRQITGGDEERDPDKHPSTFNFKEIDLQEQDSHSTEPSFEKAFDIDDVFILTPDGRQVMEKLKANEPINTSFLKQITNVVCNYLIERFGYHPATHYKNIIALSLVTKYDALKSKVANIPQALFFYPQGGKKGQHAGKIQYHLEHLVKRDNKRKNQPKATKHNETSEELLEDAGETEDQIDEMVAQLKHIVPSAESYDVIKRNWMKTLFLRNDIRKSNDKEKVQTMIDKFPTYGSFDGELVRSDFSTLHPSIIQADEKWASLQAKVLAKFNHHSLISNSFVRSLIIIREKNGTRGAKRTSSGDKTVTNVLQGVVEWMNPEDSIDEKIAKMKNPKCPILLVKATDYSEGDCFIVLGKTHFSAGSDIKQAFITLLATYGFFGLECEPDLKAFFNVIDGAVLQIRKMTTAAIDFLIKLD